jgi:hypothetical protein
LPQLRLLIGRQGVGGWCAARLAYYYQSNSAVGSFKALRTLMFIHAPAAWPRVAY